MPARGEPGSETWKGSAIDHPGAATWMTGSYDAELDTLYWAIGNPGPDMIGDERQGDNLYSDSVVALDPKTGRRKWHFQFTPHDVHDYDAQQPIVLVDATWKGQPRKLLLQANRNGYFYVLDRVTGEYLSGTPYVKNITWASGLTKEGRPIVVPNMEPTPRRAAGLPVARGRVELVLGVVQSAHGSLLRADQRQVRDLHARGSGVGSGEGLHGRHVCRCPRTGAACAARDRHPDRQGDLGTAAVRAMSIRGAACSHRQRLVFFGDDSGAFAAADAKSGRGYGASRPARSGSRLR